MGTVVDKSINTGVPADVIQKITDDMLSKASAGAIPTPGVGLQSGIEGPVNTTLQKTPYVKLVNDYKIWVEYTQNKGNCLKFDSPNDPRLIELSSNGAKVYFNVYSGDGSIHYSGRTMRAEAAVAEWKAILAGHKSAVPIPLASDNVRTGTTSELEDVLKRLVGK